MIELEPYLDSCRAALAAGLPARLTAIDSELEHPREDDYYVGVVKVPLRFPLVEVAVADWQMTDFDLGQLSATAEFTLIVSATIRTAEQSTDRLYRMLMRYTRAILNVVLDPAVFQAGGVVTSVQGGYRMNPDDRRDAAEVTGATALAFTIETSDSREL
ncbi:MAG: hypothetical protein H0U46_08030 [Actinobacteria bacterium]|nr:hypothetical protein [Actinomycetota bacterium]